MCSLRNVLAKVLAWHLPEHKLEPSGVCVYVFLRNVLAQVLILQAQVPEWYLLLLAQVKVREWFPLLLSQVQIAR